MGQLRIKELVLLENEEVMYHVEGNAYTDSPNPIEKLFSFVFRIFWVLLGIRLRTYIVATNMRIVRVDKKSKFWGLIPSDVSVVTLNKRSVQSVGYASAVRWLFFKTSYFSIQNMTESIMITYEGKHSELPKIVSAFSKLVSE